MLNTETSSTIAATKIYNYFSFQTKKAAIGQLIQEEFSFFPCWLGEKLVLIIVIIKY